MSSGNTKLSKSGRERWVWCPGLKLCKVGSMQLPLPRLSLYAAPFLLLGRVGILVSVLGKGTLRGRIQVVLGLTGRVWCGVEGAWEWSDRSRFLTYAHSAPILPVQSWRSWRHYLCGLTQGGIPSWPLPHGPLSSDPQILVWPWAAWAVEWSTPRSSP